MRRFVLMLQFFTRIPIPVNIPVRDEDDFARGIIWFPPVGLVIGLLNMAVYLAACLWWSGGAGAGLEAWLKTPTALLAAILAVGTNVLVTGGMQLDGWADSCDGLYSVRSREKMLEIMKDSRMGTFGTIGLFMNLTLRVALITATGALAGFLPVLVMILLGPVAGKAVSGLVIAWSKDAREGKGMGGMFIGRVNRTESMVCYIGGLLLCAAGSLFIPMPYQFGLLAAWLTATTAGLAFKRSVDRKIGGMTGDTLGAVSEIADMLFSLSFLLALGVWL